MEIIEQLGYFDDPSQQVPAHNPCHDAPCCVCGRPNGSQGLKYRSMMPLSGRRSYFFAYHSECAGSPKIDEFELDAADEMLDWDDASQRPKG